MTLTTKALRMTRDVPRMCGLSDKYTHVYNGDGYTPAGLMDWIANAERQRAKDRVLIPRLVRYFVPGRTLELGAAAGELSLLLQQLGRDVVASDYVEAYVQFMRGRGLVSHRVDALDIGAAGLCKFSNIFCQSISPFITSEIDVVAAAYRSCFEALEENGRIVLIHAMAPYRFIRDVMALHRNLAEEAGFRDVTTFRNQALPSSAYCQPWTGLASASESLFGKVAGVRFVLVGTR